MNRLLRPSMRLLGALNRHQPRYMTSVLFSPFLNTSPNLNNFANARFERRCSTAPPSLPGEGVRAYLLRQLSKGALQPNAAQQGVLQQLETLQRDVEAASAMNWPKPKIVDASLNESNNNNGDTTSSGGGGGFFSSFFKSSTSAAPPAVPKAATGDMPTTRAEYFPHCKGLYIWGGVGQGKTMLMDAFYETTHVESKTRVHFHHFMQRVHQLIFDLKKAGGATDDVLLQVAKVISSESKLICFDEFLVVHITDAMVLKRVFEGLFADGCVVVATSNRPPEDLYKGGLNRIRFMPCIDLIKDCCHVHELQAGKDYRLSKLVADTGGLYNVPSRPLEEVLKHAQYFVPKGAVFGPDTVRTTSGRERDLELYTDGVAVCSFDELCAKPLGAADYIAISEGCHTVFLHNVPALESLDDTVRRFIVLVDILYERNTRLVVDAVLPPFRLFGETKLVSAMQQMRLRAQEMYPSLIDFAQKIDHVFKESNENDNNQEISLEAATQILKNATHVSEEQALFIVKALGAYNSSTMRLRTHEPLDEQIAGALLFHASNYDAKVPSNDKRPEICHYHMWWQGAREKYSSSNGYQLFNDGGSTPEGDNSFAFVRTVSRLREMGSVPYLKNHQKKYNLNDLELIGIKE